VCVCQIIFIMNIIHANNLCCNFIVYHYHHLFTFPFFFVLVHFLVLHVLIDHASSHVLMFYWLWLVFGHNRFSLLNSHTHTHTYIHKRDFEQRKRRPNGWVIRNLKLAYSKSNNRIIVDNVCRMTILLLTKESNI